MNSKQNPAILGPAQQPKSQISREPKDEPKPRHINEGSPANVANVQKTTPTLTLAP